MQNLGNSLAVQWLGLGALTARAGVQSLVGELRSCTQRGTTEKKKKKSIILSLDPSLLNQNL